MSHRPIRSIIEGGKLVSAESHFTVSHAARLMREHKIGALLVCEEGRLVGPELREFVEEMDQREHIAEILG